MKVKAWLGALVAVAAVVLGGAPSLGASGVDGDKPNEPEHEVPEPHLPKKDGGDGVELEPVKTTLTSQGEGIADVCNRLSYHTDTPRGVACQQLLRDWNKISSDTQLNTGHPLVLEYPLPAGSTLTIDEDGLSLEEWATEEPCTARQLISWNPEAGLKDPADSPKKGTVLKTAPSDPAFFDLESAVDKMVNAETETQGGEQGGKQGEQQKETTEQQRGQQGGKQGGEQVGEQGGQQGGEQGGQQGEQQKETTEQQGKPKPTGEQGGEQGKPKPTGEQTSEQKETTEQDAGGKNLFGGKGESKQDIEDRCKPSLSENANEENVVTVDMVKADLTKAKETVPSDEDITSAITQANAVVGEANVNSQAKSVLAALFVIFPESNHGVFADAGVWLSKCQYSAAVADLEGTAEFQGATTEVKDLLQSMVGAGGETVETSDAKKPEAPKELPKEGADQAEPPKFKEVLGRRGASAPGAALLRMMGRPRSVAEQRAHEAEVRRTRRAAPSASSSPSIADSLDDSEFDEMW